MLSQVEHSNALAGPSGRSSDTLRVQTRVVGLDALRGVNIAAMVAVHFILVYFPVPTTRLSGALSELSSFVGPLFIFLAGAGTVFFFTQHDPIKLFKRGLFLFVLATLISIFPKGHPYLEWTLIQDIGFAFMLIAGIAWLTPYRLTATSGVCAISAATVAWQGSSVGGVFPIFPYVSYFLVGYAFALGCPVPQEGAAGSSRATVALAAPLGSLAVGLITASWLQDAQLGWLDEILIISGVCMTLYFLFVYVLANWRWEGFLGDYILLLGRASLTAYYMQQVLLRTIQATHLRPVVINPEVSYLALCGLVSGLLYVSLRVWKRLDFALSLEWWMHKL